MTKQTETTGVGDQPPEFLNVFSNMINFHKKYDSSKEMGKYDPYTWEEKAIETALNDEVNRERLQSIMICKFKELKETMLKGLKEGMKIIIILIKGLLYPEDITMIKIYSL